MSVLQSVEQMLSTDFLGHGPTLARVLAALSLLALPALAQNKPVRVIAFGAHPDDCDLGAGDGRTSAHDPRLLAAQQPSCHEQVPAGDIEDQTLGTRQIGRRDLADGYFAEDKPNPMNAVWNRSGMGPFSFGAYRPLTSPDLPDVRIASG